MSVSGDVMLEFLTRRVAVGGSSVNPAGSPDRLPGRTRTSIALELTVRGVKNASSASGSSSHIHPAPQESVSKYETSPTRFPVIESIPHSRTRLASESRSELLRSGSPEPRMTRSPARIPLWMGEGDSTDVRNLYPGPSNLSATAVVRSFIFEAGCDRLRVLCR